MEAVTALPLNLLLRAVAALHRAGIMVAKSSRTMSAMNISKPGMEEAAARLATPVMLSELQKEPESRVENPTTSWTLELKNGCTVKPSRFNSVTL